MPDTDLDFSGCVDLPDLSRSLADFGCGGPNCLGDLDSDGSTDLTDLSTLPSNFGACR